MQARDAGEGRQRGYDVSGLINSVKSGNYEAPVLLKLATGTYVIGGRTRLYAALALGIPAKVKIISVSTFAKQGQQGVAESTGQQLSVQQLAAVSDEALDNAYHYGRSQPGNTFGWQANLKSAAFAKQMIDKGVTDIEAISDAIHKGWNVTAQAFVKNPMMFDDSKTMAPEKLQAKVAQRQKLMTQQYAQLPEDEKEKDRVVARAMLQAITGGQQGVAEGQQPMNRNAVIQKLETIYTKLYQHEDPESYDLPAAVDYWHSLPADQLAMEFEDAIAKLKQSRSVTEDTGSWIVYDPKTRQIKKRFKTHTAGKSYAQTHGLGFASSEYYFDRVKEKAVAEEAAPQVNDAWFKQGAFQTYKKAAPIKYTVPGQPGTVQTLEGPVNHSAQARIITGPKGEQYPVEPAKFAELYDDNGNGVATPKKIPKLAKLADHNGVLHTSWGDLQYTAGNDYIVRHGANDYGAVKKDIFAQTYALPQGVAEAKTDYQKRREYEKAVELGKKVPKPRQSSITDYQKRRAEQKRQEELGEDGEGTPEGLPHLTRELLSHIVDQVGSEGAHAIVKSLEWGDGAAEELLVLILKDLKQDIGQEEIDETIRKVKGGYRLVSHTGKNLGTYPTKGGAEKRERQVQYFKHANESTNYWTKLQQDRDQRQHAKAYSLLESLQDVIKDIK